VIRRDSLSSDGRTARVTTPAYVYLRQLLSVFTKSGGSDSLHRGPYAGDLTDREASQ